MEDIYVYFNDKYIYNASDMSCLYKMPNTSRKTIYKYLKVLNNLYNIKVYIINLNQIIRNEIYCLNPEAVVVINPDVVKQLLYKKVANNIEQRRRYSYFEDEVAVTYDNSKDNWLYDFTTKEEAKSYYRIWQQYIPIGIKKYHDIIRTIDYYSDEIFNYFDHKHIIDNLQIKNNAR